MKLSLLPFIVPAAVAGILAVGTSGAAKNRVSSGCTFGPDLAAAAIGAGGSSWTCGITTGTDFDFTKITTVYADFIQVSYSSAVRACRISWNSVTVACSESILYPSPNAGFHEATFGGGWSNPLKDGGTWDYRFVKISGSSGASYDETALKPLGIGVINSEP